MIALWRKSLRDYWLLIALLALGTVVFEVFVVRMILEAAQDLESLRTWLARPMIQTLVRIALGADIAGDLTPTAMTAFGMAHPLLYALTWALVLTICTALPAGEIDRGTADLLLTLPVRRSDAYLANTLVWLPALALLSVTPLLGLHIGERIWPLEKPLEFGRLWPTALNLWALHISVAGVTMFCSSVLSRRGYAIGIVVAALLVSDLLNLLAQFWQAAESVSRVAHLHYYKPLPVIRAGAPDWPDIAILLAVGAVAWLLGWLYFSRRDIPAA